MNYRLFFAACLMSAAAVFAETAVDTAAVAAVGDASSAVADTSAIADTSAVADTSAAAAVINKDAAVDTTVITNNDAVAVDTAVITDKDAAAVDTAAITDNETAADTAARRGLDLDRLLAEDDEEDDLLAEDKPAAQPEAADSASAIASAPDSVQTESVQAEPPADSSGQPAARPVVQGRRGGPPPPADRDKPIDDGPAVIVDGKTINFAQNLEGYRSPRLAMLLSLLVPGLGQAYAHNYTKAAAFGVVEVAGIVAAATLNSMGKSKKRDAHRFADEHFDVDRMKDYGTWVTQEFENIVNRDGNESENPPQFDDPSILQNYDTTFYNAAARRSSFFYTSIGDMYFTPGWIDSDPSWRDREYDGDGNIVGTNYAKVNPDTSVAARALFYWIKLVVDASGNSVNGEPILAFSNYQARYNSMVKDANSYHDAVNYTLYALIINHIASAIDAGFTARAYNARLLGQESVWDRITVEQQFVFTGSEMSPGIALRLKF